MTEQLDAGLSLAPFDWAIVAVLAISTLMSLRRGFLKEALSLGTWIAAFVVARQFHEPMDQLLETHIVDSLMRSIAAFAALFVGTLLIGAALGFCSERSLTPRVYHPQIVCWGWCLDLREVH